MKQLFGVTLCAWLVASSPALAQPAAPSSARSASPASPAHDPASLALARQILSIAYPADKRSQMMDTMITAIVDQSTKALDTAEFSKDPEFQALIERSTKRMWDQFTASMQSSLPDYFDSMAQAYARSFSRDDLEAILAFVKTPTGQRYFGRAPLILKDPAVQAAAQRLMAKMMMKVPELSRENKQDIEDYVAKKLKQEKSADHPANAAI